ncbi:TPA: HTH domain-containing protein, partial [Listeria monocytogenes]|nr:HTH domain-containing protein [Listeria monocytogenes]
MNKSERLNDMMLFLNDKNTFQLSDIMTKYDISRSTAIRDIKSLEEIGMPIYSERGRNGHYQVLRNRLLSPIVFNIDEVFALYFSMLTLKAYETTPFHLSVEKLKTKFERCLSAEKIEMLRKTEEVFSLGYIKHNNQCE